MTDKEVTKETNPKEPEYDFEEAVSFILARMLDQNRPHRERFPIEMIEEGCLCRRLVETVLSWDYEYTKAKGLIKNDETSKL